MTGPATPSDGAPFGEASQRTGNHETRNQLRSALLALGFRTGETDRAVVALSRDDDTTWQRPIETLLREALAILT